MTNPVFDIIKGVGEVKRVLEVVCHILAVRQPLLLYLGASWRGGSVVQIGSSNLTLCDSRTPAKLAPLRKS